MSKYLDRVVRMESEIGFLIDARVLAYPNPLDEGAAAIDKDESPLLCELIGVAHPDDQPAQYRKHARIWAGTAIPAGDGVFNAPLPSDDNEIRLVDEDDVWDNGEFVLETHEPKRYERAENIPEPLPANIIELRAAQAVRKLERHGHS